MTKKKNIEYEVCVSCNKVTNIPIDMHIDNRMYYVEGAGQLCSKCYFTVYGWSNKRKTNGNK